MKKNLCQNLTMHKDYGEWNNGMVLTKVPEFQTGDQCMEENINRLKANDGAEQPLKGPGTHPEVRSKVYSFPAGNNSDIEIAKATAKRLKLPFVDPVNTVVEPAVVSLLDPEIAFRRQALPIRLVDGTLLVAMLAPDHPVSVRSLEILTGFKIRPAAAPKDSLYAALERYYGNGNPNISIPRQKVVKKGTAESTESSQKGPFNISIISNKGGVGKTHLSINLSYAIARTGARVLLIDADLGNADISNKLGLFPKYHLMDFLEKKKQMQELIIPTEFGFDLIGGSYGEFKLANLYHAQKIKFINHFKKISRKYDFAVFDLGAGISRTVLDFALAADHTLIVTTPQDVISGYACTKAGFSRFKEIEERLEEKMKDYQPQLTFAPMLVANQVSDLSQGFELYETVKKTAEKNVNSVEDKFNIKLDYLGAVLYDKQSLRVAEEKRKPLLLTSPRAKASQSIHHMSTKFCNPEGSYNPNLKFKHPLRRFAAILSQR